MPKLSWAVLSECRGPTVLLFIPAGLLLILGAFLLIAGAFQLIPSGLAGNP